ncbi:hypothetical protein PoB_002075100 [Plakobranchus ocellatus]|uniref:Uncharacterized protein n=1 Tax=Plakobranchus ocellatus TaxID=259542 RepID=A0AAV3ZEC1_9GAST|nr:hypothetical protein PoB_002075100 [Plakobranchus ocellatus]
MVVVEVIVVANVEVLEQAEIPSIEALIAKSQLRWAGHVFRMKDHRLPKIALYGEIRSGHRYRGAPKKRYKDCLKRPLLHEGEEEEGEEEEEEEEERDEEEEQEEEKEKDKDEEEAEEEEKDEDEEE